jgi:hypothetical protein
MVFSENSARFFRTMPTKAGPTAMTIDDKTRTELEAAAFRRLVGHLRARTDVQNIDLMNLAGFCRNCLSNWMKEEADAMGVAVSKDESREAIYGMPYETWKSKFQGSATPEQLEAMKKTHSGH